MATLAGEKPLHLLVMLLLVSGATSSINLGFAKVGVSRTKLWKQCVKELKESESKSKALERELMYLTATTRVEKISFRDAVYTTNSSPAIHKASMKDLGWWNSLRQTWKTDMDDAVRRFSRFLHVLAGVDKDEKISTEELLAKALRYRHVPVGDETTVDISPILQELANLSWKFETLQTLTEEQGQWCQKFPASFSDQFRDMSEKISAVQAMLADPKFEKRDANGYLELFKSEMATFNRKSGSNRDDIQAIQQLLIRCVKTEKEQHSLKQLNLQLQDQLSKLTSSKSEPSLPEAVADVLKAGLQEMRLVKTEVKRYLDATDTVNEKDLKVLKLQHEVDILKEDVLKKDANMEKMRSVVSEQQEELESQRRSVTSKNEEVLFLRKKLGGCEETLKESKARKCCQDHSNEPPAMGVSSLLQFDWIQSLKEWYNQNIGSWLHPFLQVLANSLIWENLNLWTVIGLITMSVTSFSGAMVFLRWIWPLVRFSVLLLLCFKVVFVASCSVFWFAFITLPHTLWIAYITVTSLVVSLITFQHEEAPSTPAAPACDVKAPVESSNTPEVNENEVAVAAVAEAMGISSAEPDGNLASGPPPQRCQLCNQRGHSAQQCERFLSNIPRRKGQVCKRCHQVGHPSWRCPKRPVVPSLPCNLCPGEVYHWRDECPIWKARFQQQQGQEVSVNKHYQTSPSGPSNSGQDRVENARVKGHERQQEEVLEVAVGVAHPGRQYVASGRLEDETNPRGLLIDSGATANLISRKVCEGLGVVIKPSRITRVTGVFGNSNPVTGEVTIKTQIGIDSHEVTYLVLNDIQRVILGCPGLEQFQFSLDFVDGCLHTPSNNKICCRVQATKKQKN